MHTTDAAILFSAQFNSQTPHLSQLVCVVDKRFRSDFNATLIKVECCIPNTMEHGMSLFTYYTYTLKSHSHGSVRLNSAKQYSLQKIAACCSVH